MSNDHAAQRERLADGLLSYGASFAELGRRFAAELGVHATDAFALLEIASAESLGTPISPALLSKRIALTSGAMSSLLNRLEDAGYITRTREHTDRRVVTLRAGAQVKERADEFFRPCNERQDAILAEYPPEILNQFETLLRRLTASLTS
ncbi:MarR family winged helix-turn-helix transcriptional regulator [Nocardia amikacinitolerans]|uniref:MarR family winged helix-turn-helix transcriptional regulator n=1 Tax=Nocardia amikacinitolerans TaxID=756689 RepID=UPI0020A34B89|nr:MarR family transcriptional regulator [Nocardia amikacinitolerans]MCP2292492.1 DNA-binding transcriptional regulator, MarR family [Nocardia amikacinitolerans]